MPKHAGVYRDGSGGWYFKARTHRDPVTEKWQQVTRRGFRTAGEAAQARRELLDTFVPPPDPRTVLRSVGWRR